MTVRPPAFRCLRFAARVSLTHATRDAVLFDLPTALLGSWSVWDRVAGSGFDLIGTAAVGLRTLWHNRAGLAPPPRAPAPVAERRTLRELLPFLLEGGR